MSDSAKQRPYRARTLFLSDIHLGYSRARARELVDFLQSIEAETIVLVGDIVDGMSLAKRFFWAEEHTQVVRMLLARRRAGARLLYLPGNHDASLAIFADLLRGQVEVHREWVHRTARGERLLITHGDRFDEDMACQPWLYFIGDVLYEATLAVNHRLNDVRRSFGWPYHPLAERLKLAVGTSVRYIRRFEQLAAAHARTEGYDGIVCGHIHRPNLCRIDGTIYCNTGDWVESCSALIEDLSGELQLRRWPHSEQRTYRLEPPPPLLADAA
jgi:UDP-2,3-diacylglucosamine pyrophosphatase LpxH